MNNPIIPEQQPFPLPAFSDNYIWLIRSGQQAIVVDPGDSNVVKKALDHAGLTLTAILITHHHPDHTGGVSDLCAHYPNVEVFGPAATNHPSINRIVDDGTQFSLPAFNLSFNVVATPGHTLDHHCFVAQHTNKPDWLFCGDTLFSGGCGRLFEGSPTQMHASLQKLASLPASTAVYCTHEYTMANLTFAIAADPNNEDLQNYQQQITKKRQNNEPSLPSDIATELKINPFLRCNTPGVRDSLSKHTPQDGNLLPLRTETDCFAALRQWKDHF